LVINVDSIKMKVNINTLAEARMY